MHLLLQVIPPLLVDRGRSTEIVYVCFVRLNNNATHVIIVLVKQISMSLSLESHFLCTDQVELPCEWPHSLVFEEELARLWFSKLWFRRRTPQRK